MPSTTPRCTEAVRCFDLTAHQLQRHHGRARHQGALNCRPSEPDAASNRHLVYVEDGLNGEEPGMPGFRHRGHADVLSSAHRAETREDADIISQHIARWRRLHSIAQLLRTESKLLSYHGCAANVHLSLGGYGCKLWSQQSWGYR
jgi:hypothetical protein